MKQKNKRKKNNFFNPLIILFAKYRLQIISFFGVVILSLFILFFQNIDKISPKYLQTSLLSSVISSVAYLQNKFINNKKCADVNNWEGPKESEVCNYYLYFKTNKYCKSVGISDKRPFIGTKICCEGESYEKFKDKLIPCPGANIFFAGNNTHNSSLVKNKDKCSTNVCEFYPKEGYHIFTELNGKLAVAKDCQEKTVAGACSRPCGGGHRLVTTTMKDCSKFIITEQCNPDPCVFESSN